MPMRRPLVARAIAWPLAVLGVAIATWLVANRWLDEAVTPERAALTATVAGSVPDHKNVAVGILGLTAPRGTNFMAHGARVKALIASHAPHDQIQQLIHGSNALRPTVDRDQIRCWLDPDQLVSKGCLPFERAPSVLEDHQELLQRYKALYRLDQYEALDIHYNEAFLLLTQLAVAEMHLYARKGDREAAYRNWHAQLRFLRANLRGMDTWVGKAVGVVAIGMALPFLERLVLADPGIARRHRTELYAVLRAEGIDAYDPRGIARAEFKMLVNALEYPPASVPGYGRDPVHWLAFHLGQKSRILNRHAAFLPDYEARLRLPFGSEQNGELERARDRHLDHSRADLLLDPFGTVFLEEYIDSQLRGHALLRQMHMIDARLRLATMGVSIINERIKDADIPRFLSAADADLRDPFSRAPFQWDPNDRKIFFVEPADKCSIAAWFSLPSRKPPRAAPSDVRMTAC